MPTIGELVYDAVEYSFYVAPHVPGVAWGVMNELEIVFGGDDVCAESIIGYCPHYSWEQAELSPPDARMGIVSMRDAGGLLDGFPIDIESPDHGRWPVFFDPDKWLVCVGNPCPGFHDIAVKFRADSIIVLENNSIKSLWLSPKWIPNYETVCATFNT
ncbi:MAG: hypothetical protein LBG44_11360 [Gemmatimonadota bacterium]|nr:hypothetical protein [Gemmatimonadota bacterium]